MTTIARNLFMTMTLALLVLATATAAAAGPVPGSSPFRIPGSPPGLNAPVPMPADAGDEEPVTASIKAAATEVRRGSDLPVAIVLEIEKGWHIWTNQRPMPAGVATFDAAEHTRVSATAEPAGAFEPHVGFVQWPEIHVVSGIAGLPEPYGVFEEHTVIHLPVTVPADAPLGAAMLKVTVDWQACDDNSCRQPVTKELVLLLTIVEADAIVTQSKTIDADLAGFPPGVFGDIRAGKAAPELISFDLFGIVSFTINAAGWGLLLLLLAAMLGGFLLNLTPCVLPVIPIKIMGLASAAAGSRARTLALGIAMAWGVIGFWLLLGAMIAGLSTFTATNQLFQYPAFTITVGVFIAIMAIGMCGLFSIRLPQAVYLINPKHETLHGSFIFGIMAAILSTPCTAPFMGAAAAWAAAQPVATTLLTFAAIGFGMALPYLVLAAWPSLVKRMPRTGPASELIKHVMGLLLLAAAAYFIGVGVSGALVTPPDPPSRLYWWVVAALGTAAGLWLLYRTLRITSRTSRRVAFGGIGALVAVISVAIGFRMTDPGPINWTYYTPERFTSAIAEGDVVVMEFTAEWCLSCKALEESVLRSPRIATALNSENVTPIKVDLTGNNTLGNQMLGRVGRLTIPLLVVFRPDGSEVFKGDFYTVQQVIEAVETAAAPRLAKDGG